MWLILAFTSAALLGLYDVAKKQAVKNNAVPTVLLLNTLFSSLLFLPVIISSECDLGWFGATIFDVEPQPLRSHLLIILKSAIVLSSWIFGYFGIKHLPLTLVGPINATRPVLVLVGAMLLFGERLNTLQWIGVLLALVSIFMLSRAGKKEGIDFTHNRWILCVAAAAILGAASGLYDRYIMQELEPLFVQSWYNIYQLTMMAIAVMLIHLLQPNRTPFHWSWAIPLISLFLSAADLAYFVALSNQEAMISVVSMIRRGSVVVSFACGAMLFREKNLRAKAIDLIFILAGMIFLWLGSR
ncbi:MAG: EamA family transporter [Alistipes sp.]|nr:EamA family transporter [Rikenellaceae bacterium]MBO5276890.1 EamA family transporter [Alistipes sp.]MBO5331798.1 EamA family transporter [Alistipes sp.]MBP3601351.1 EamA family transporter [Alistipes sp.]MBQ3213252.1 EamA family transporter [Alistipes sp.]